MTDTGKRVKLNGLIQRKQVMKVQVKVPGRYLQHFFLCFPFHRYKAVHFNTADQAFIKMIKGAYIQPVQLLADVTDRSQVDACGFLCACTQGRQQQEDDEQPPYKSSVFHYTKEAHQLPVGNEAGRERG